MVPKYFRLLINESRETSDDYGRGSLLAKPGIRRTGSGQEPVVYSTEMPINPLRNDTAMQQEHPFHVDLVRAWQFPSLKFSGCVNLSTQGRQGGSDSGEPSLICQKMMSSPFEFSELHRRHNQQREQPPPS